MPDGIQLTDLTLGLAGLLLAIILIRDVVRPLLQVLQGRLSRQPCRPAAANGGLAAMVHDLHAWHAPDSAGRQNWKGSHLEDILEEQNRLSEARTRVLQENRVAVEALKAEMSSVLQAIRKQTACIESHARAIEALISETGARRLPGRVAKKGPD